MGDYWNLVLEGLYAFFECLAIFIVACIRVMVMDILILVSTLLYIVMIPFNQLIPDVLNQPLPTLEAEWIGYINYLFPVGTLAELYIYGITAFGIYRILRWVANRAKAPIQPTLF